MKQNTAIITGASEGIGAALTKLLIQHDWKVIGLSRNLEKLEYLQNNLCENKDYLSIYACDVQDFSKLRLKPITFHSCFISNFVSAAPIPSLAPVIIAVFCFIFEFSIL